MKRSEIKNDEIYEVKEPSIANLILRPANESKEAIEIRDLAVNLGCLSMTGAAIKKVLEHSS